MRRTGSEEIGASKALGRRKDSWRTEAFAFSDFFGEAPERRPWITEHEDAGRSLPGFIFAFVFYWLELPTDCAIEPECIAFRRDHIRVGDA
jgi:hypothetical protein